MQRMAKVAFDATRDSTVVVSERRLVQEGLDVDTVQDLVIVFHNRKGASAKIMKGERKLHFTHQTVQECFAALHILQGMSVVEFQDFAESIFLIFTQCGTSCNLRTMNIFQARILRNVRGIIYQ